MNDQVERWIAVLSLAVPVAAFLWEFFVVGRKRLGYRVQMDTLAADAIQSQHAEVLRGLERDGHRLKDPSFVLLRIENAGSAQIEAADYLAPAHVEHGVKVTFRERQVAAMVVTELSQAELGEFFSEVDETGQTVATPGFRFDNNDGSGVIRLPKATLPRGAEYKVLVVLERRPDDPGTGPFPDPVFLGAVGSGTRWFDPLTRFLRLKLTRTESHVFASRPAWYGIWVLAAAVVAQAVLVLVPNGPRPPLDCVGGELRLHGSSAFAPAVRAAAEDLVERCEGSGLAIDLDGDIFEGSTEGIGDLVAAAEDAGIRVGAGGLGDHLAFTDGKADENRQGLRAHPVAFLVFAVVVNKDTGVDRLTTGQLRRIFAGEITNWAEVGGADAAVHLVNRDARSGTRATLVDKVLDGNQPPQFTERDCAALHDGSFGVCEVGDTDAMLRAVGDTPGAIGYSEAHAVDGSAAAPLRQITLDDRPARADQVGDDGYPFWQTEFAYTFGDPPPGSVAAAFLTFLTQQSGRDILEDRGHGLCSETRNADECSPI